MARRADAILLLDRGWGCDEMSDAVLLDDDTIRGWFKGYRDGGVPALESFDFGGGHCSLSVERLASSKAWATTTLPASTNAVGRDIETTFGVSDTRSGVVTLMAAIDVVCRTPDQVPSHLDLDAQKADEAIVYGDAVHPTHQTRPAGVWMPRDAGIAVPAASGRDRMNIHGVIDLETGATLMRQVLWVDAQSTIDRLTAIENAYATMQRIHVCPDDARYRHTRVVQGWMRRPGRRIVLRCIPSHYPHLNPTGRLWGVMHQNVTHNPYDEALQRSADAVLTFLGEDPSKELRSVFAPDHRHFPRSRHKGFSGRRVVGVHRKSSALSLHLFTHLARVDCSPHHPKKKSFGCAFSSAVVTPLSWTASPVFGSVMVALPLTSPVSCSRAAKFRKSADGRLSLS